MLESEVLDAPTMNVAVYVPSIVEESLLTHCTSPVLDRQVTSADDNANHVHTKFPKVLTITMSLHTMFL